MGSEAEIIERVRVVFRKAKKPEHFTNFAHCDECLEHDELLCSRNVQTLTFKDVGNPGWNPICYISPEGFAYYFPAFVRITLAADGAETNYLAQFLFHLTYKDRENRHLRHFNSAQRSLVVSVLRYIAEHRGDLIDGSDDNDLNAAIELWSKR